MSVVDFRNLSNGLNCPCKGVTFPRIIRIQSTACEQKLWGNIVMTAGAELYYNLAIGNLCIIHDKSERNRETRACWQGLSWLRFAVRKSWGLPIPPERGRGGHLLTPYWEEMFLRLSKQERRMLDFYRRFHTGGNIHLSSCWIDREGGQSKLAHRAKG